MNPLTGIAFTKLVGLEYGEGQLRYQETLSNGRIQSRLFFSKRGTGRPSFTRSFPVMDPGVCRRWREEHPSKYGDWEHVDWTPTAYNKPFPDGICLICGEIEPFVLEKDHVFGRANSDFVINLCANCHRLKTDGRFWLLERRLK